MKIIIRIRQHDSSTFIACCPALPGCTSRGQTPDQARAKLEEAIRGYLASVNNFVPDQIQSVVESCA